MSAFHDEFEDFDGDLRTTESGRRMRATFWICVALAALIVVVLKFNGCAVWTDRR